MSESGADAEESLRALKENVAHSVSQLARTDLKDVLQAEILLELMKGQRTTNELVEAVYHVSPDNPGYRTCYTRVGRNLADMRSRGYVSRRLLGKEKPYRMTPLAVARISAIRGVAGTDRTKIFPREDIVIYALSILLGVASLVFSEQVGGSNSDWFPVVFSCFLFTSGAAVTRLYDSLRSVA